MKKLFERIRRTLSYWLWELQIPIPDDYATTEEYKESFRVWMDREPRK